MKLFKGEIPVIPIAEPIKYPDSKIGERLRLFRKSLGMKGVAFSKYIKTSQGSLSDLENSKSLPSATTLINLYRQGCDIHWLLTGDK